MTLETLNLAGEVTGMTCGGCQDDSDCASFGAGATCSDGLCVGGDPSGDEQADETGEVGETGEPLDCESPAPSTCLTLIECVGAIVPSQRAAVEEAYGDGASCWCGTPDEVAACAASCVTQLNAALQSNPTEPACQASSCSLDELDPNQPYGPVTNGSCPNWMGGDQLAAASLFGLPGSFCAPECAGATKTCPQHMQTAAAGTCTFSAGGVDRCALRCWVDSTLVGGRQCQCGARCQPHGPADGEGNQRGICTFE